jgi:hypothetical protein
VEVIGREGRKRLDVHVRGGIVLAIFFLRVYYSSFVMLGIIYVLLVASFC